MKENFIFKACLVVLAMCAVFGCNELEERPVQEQEYEVQVIDSCEYLVGKNNKTRFTHKGNCKFCQHRIKEAITIQVDSILLDIFD